MKNIIHETTRKQYKIYFQKKIVIGLMPYEVVTSLINANIGI